MAMKIVRVVRFGIYFRGGADRIIYWKIMLKKGILDELSVFELGN